MRAPYFVVTTDSIYFSNYSNGGYLFKSDIDGMNIVQINKNHSVDLAYQNGYLYYINRDANVTEKFFVGVKKEKTIHEESSFALFKEFKNVKLDKVWTIKLNDKLDKTTVNNRTVYITDEEGYLVPGIEVTTNTSQNSIVVKNPQNFKSDQTYTLYVTNKIKNENGLSLKKAIKVRFETE